MTVSKRVNGNMLTAVVRGEIDADNCSDLRVALEEFGAKDVIVDMAGVTFLDSSGISELLLCRSRVLAAGRSFVVARPSRVVEQVLTITGLGETFGLTDVAEGN